MPKKSKGEIETWVKDSRRKKGDKLDIGETQTGSPSVTGIKRELEKL